MARGFASMTPEKRKEVSRAGGRAAHALGTAHRFTKDTAKAAGRKGGLKTSATPGHMSTIGKSGARASWKKRREKAEELL